MKAVAFIAGAAVGMAASVAVLHSVRPDVTMKMLRDGRRTWMRCKKSMGM